MEKEEESFIDIMIREAEEKEEKQTEAYYDSSASANKKL